MRHFFPPILSKQASKLKLAYLLMNLFHCLPQEVAIELKEIVSFHLFLLCGALFKRRNKKCLLYIEGFGIVFVICQHHYIRPYLYGPESNQYLTTDSNIRRRPL